MGYVIEILEDTPEYTKRIVNYECPECPSSRAIHAAVKSEGVRSVYCKQCERVHERANGNITPA